MIGFLVGMTGAGGGVLPDVRGGESHTGLIHDVVPRPLRTVAIGMVGGIVVGRTSVGSDSLMIIFLLFLYPMLGASHSGRAAHARRCARRARLRGP
jgi:uncharacterized protein